MESAQRLLFILRGGGRACRQGLCTLWGSSASLLFFPFTERCSACWRCSSFCLMVAQKPSGCSWGLEQGFLICSEASSSFSQQDSLTGLVAYRIVIHLTFSVKPELPICGCISSEAFKPLTVLDQPRFLCVVESPLIPAWREADYFRSRARVTVDESSEEDPESALNVGQPRAQNLLFWSLTLSWTT